MMVALLLSLTETAVPGVLAAHGIKNRVVDNLDQVGTKNRDAEGGETSVAADDGVILDLDVPRRQHLNSKTGVIDCGSPGTQDLIVADDDSVCAGLQADPDGPVGFEEARLEDNPALRATGWPGSAERFHAIRKRYWLSEKCVTSSKAFRSCARPWYFSLSSSRGTEPNSSSLHLGKRQSRSVAE